jgi:hypothetical protein
MNYYPKSRKEAEGHRYGAKGYKRRFNSKTCAYEVAPSTWGPQCLRDPGHGPDKLFCKQHAKMIESKKEE